MAIFKAFRQKRVNKLLSFGMTFFEAREITRPKITTATGRKLPSPFRFFLTKKRTVAVNLMIEHRQEVLAKAKADGIKARDAIKADYEDNGWVDEWDMLRYFLDESEPPKKGKRHGDGISKGNVAAQKERARERQKGNKREWLAELRQNISRTTDPEKKARLEKQAERMERMLSR